LIIDDFLKRFKSGDRTALARAMTWVENDSAKGNDVLNKVYAKVGQAHRIGVTGPPGAGKSTTVEKLTHNLRKLGKSIGIVAVDPTSPFTGGAILGDRIRMNSLFADKDVFIRSMATRGSLGGLAGKTKMICDLMDAFGKEVVIIETVGVGQAELDVVKAAHTTLVVLVPESGDGIQAMKAGLMEIGDLFVVNKADREGADRVTTEIEMMLELRPEKTGWNPPVLQTVASQGENIDKLTQSIIEHFSFLQKFKHIEEFRFEHIKSEISDMVNQRHCDSFWSDEKVIRKLNTLVKEVIQGKKSPYQAHDELLHLANR